MQQRKKENEVAKIAAKLFMASAMGFFELLICEGCKNLLFGAGKVNGIKKLEQPKFCPHCGQEIEVRLTALSEKEIMSYADPQPPEEKPTAKFSTVRPAGLDKTLLACSGCKKQFEWPAFGNNPKNCPYCGVKFTDGHIRHPVKQ